MRIGRVHMISAAALAGLLIVAAVTSGGLSTVYAGLQEPTPTPTVPPTTATPTEVPTEVPTETPAPTETAVPATETPVPPTATTAPGGEPGAGVQPPRTGTGGASDGGPSVWWALGGALGGAALLLGGARMALRRR